MATRKVARKKSASPSKPAARRVHKDAEYDKGANTDAIESKDASGGKPKIHAKVISLIVSVGTEDRNKTHEQFVDEVLKRLGKVPYGKEGIHASVVGGYYILDGKVCRPEDYDAKKQTFKKGAVPPSWAGGPKPSNIRLTSMQEQMQRDIVELSSAEYDKKYRLGKYAPIEKQGKVITPAEQKARLTKIKKDKLLKEEEELEEILSDDEALSAAASASASRAIRILKNKPKQKRVVKKSTPTKKRTVKVKK